MNLKKFNKAIPYIVLIIFVGVYPRELQEKAPSIFMFLGVFIYAMLRN